MTLTDKVKTMAHCAVDCGIIDAVNWSAEIIEAIENWDPRKPVDKETEYSCGKCDTHVAYKDDYCWKCGQAIDWSEE